MASPIPTSVSPHSIDDEAIDLLVRPQNDIMESNLKSKRHTKLVRLMRLIFPVAALIVVAILMTWRSEQAPLAPVPREKISPQTVSQNELLNPKFQSEDMNSNPYTITADKATQNAEDMDIILLDKPVANMTFKSGSHISVLSEKGAYKQESGNLVLNNGVEIKHDSGYQLRTERMDIDVKKQTLHSTTTVTGQGPAGQIESSGLEANGATKIIIFNGPAKLTFINHKE